MAKARINGTAETLKYLKEKNGPVSLGWIEPNVAAYVSSGLEYVFYSKAKSAEQLLRECESPIERMFMAAIWARAMPNQIEGWDAQVKIGPYRVDFVYTHDMDGLGIPIKIAVELDGHEFHEKTKAQAKRDKAKDRYLQKQGYYVFRYTGSEVFNDPEKCIDEVEEFSSERFWETNNLEDIENTVNIINNIKKASNSGVYMFKRDRGSTAGRPLDDQIQTKERPKVVDPSTSAKEECDRDGVA